LIATEVRLVKAVNLTDATLLIGVGAFFSEIESKKFLV
jgi:hypothetical protein